MAYRIPPVLPVPPQFASAIAAAMDPVLPALQHQDELTAFLTWTQTLTPPLDFRVIVEIGSHRGGTLELWARLATTCVIGIDLPNGFGGGQSLAQMTARYAEMTARFPHFHGIAGDSHARSTVHDLRRHLPAPVDLLFIDGDHTYRGVELDYTMYAPFVRPGGVIAFHDVTCQPARAAADRVEVPEFFATLPEPKHVFSVGGEWGGIGAVIAG